MNVEKIMDQTRVMQGVVLCKILQAETSVFKKLFWVTNL